MGLLEVLIVIFLILWITGTATAYTAGGALHILLVIVIVLVIVRLVQNRNAAL